MTPLRARSGLFAPVLLLAGIVTPAAAQDGPKIDFLKDRPFYEPLLAEPRPARTMLLIPAWSKEFPDSVNKGARFAWQISLGDELPILTLSNDHGGGALGSKGTWGLGLWVPLSFHVIEDFKDDSNPIVDTDYRFGFMTKFQCFCFEKMKLGARFVPWAHESTHLGDEYTIFAQQQNPDFERINVSHEEWEYGISLEGDGLFKDDDMWKLRHGGKQPWSSGGYYSNHLLGSEEPDLTPSQRNFEPSFGVEYRFAPRKPASRQFYLSADLRHQLIYNYHQTPENPEEKQWSINFQVGTAVQEDTHGTPLKQLFFQISRGVNPYGQLRSQRDFWSAGLGFVFGL